MLTGYGDRLTAGPGDRVEFKVNSATAFDLRIVRLLQGDDTEAGPGFREREVGAGCDGRYPPKAQRTRPGSYVRVDGHGAGPPVAGVTLAAWVWPTAPGRGRQAVLTSWAEDGSGYGLEIVEGRAVFSVRSGDRTAGVSAEGALTRDWWHFIAAGFDPESGRLFVWQVPHDPARRPELGSPVRVRHELLPMPDPRPGPLLIAAATVGSSVGAHFNGRISAPRCFGRALDAGELAQVAGGNEVGNLREVLWGAWDLSPALPTALVVDRSGHGRDGTAVNNPARAVRGHLWDGTALRPVDAPDHYDCMHFHDDDLADAGWETTAVFEIPPDLPSGVYAARLRNDEDEDYLPFVISPGRKARERARALFILPTLTYLAYANEHFYNAPFIDWSRASDRPLRLDSADQEIQRHPEFGHSLYDVHSDGTYTMYSSRLRPILNFRPKIVSYWNGAGRHLCADLYMLGWLHRENIPVDVVTDEDLHQDGADLLDHYDVVITGSHPEYTTEPMLDALARYAGTGGRIMYLGGNGFWWRTTIDPTAPHIIEVRKPAGIDGTRGSGVLPGEQHHSQDGTLGGGWRPRGRGPETWLGVGYRSQGFARAEPYHRTEASHDPEVSWIFDGVTGEEIGAFGLALGGAAGDEMDAAQEQGTPPHTVVLASSRDHHDAYLMFGGTYAYRDVSNANRRSDIAYTATANGGAVFAAGSMCWYPSLAYNDYDNDVARITRNILNRFLQAPRATL